MKAEENLGAASGGAALVKAYIGVGSPACQHLVIKKAVVLGLCRLSPMCAADGLIHDKK
jgi:hypothetical protein